MRRRSRIRGPFAVVLGLAVVAGGCSPPLTPTAAPSNRPSSAGPIPGESLSATIPPTVPPTSGPGSTPADLTARPLVWFAPLPPMPTGPGREFTGSDDFMDLFDDAAPWSSAASRVGVFKLYGEWVAYHATDAQLRAAVEGIAARGQVLAVEMGPLDPAPECGAGIEGFAGLDEARLISRRIRLAGGALQVVALDEPWYFAHVADGPGACRWSVDEVVTGVRRFAEVMRAEWPGIVIGDTEPTPGPVDASGLLAWLRAYRAGAGEPLAFLHLDPDWSRPNWAAMAADVRDGAANLGVPVGVIFNGGAATSDAAWLSTAGTRVLDYATAAEADPDHVIFQSWMDKPDRALPESDPLTFTALIDRYVTDRAALGEPLAAVTNLALGQDVTATSALPGSGPAKAVDGIADTTWNAGGGPPAAIEIDLGEPLAIGEIRLLVGQSPPGATDHRLWCRATMGAEPEAIGRLRGTTADLDVLTLTLSQPATCRFVRVQTLQSPSWIAWREIELYPPS